MVGSDKLRSCWLLKIRIIGILALDWTTGFRRKEAKLPENVPVNWLPLSFAD